jgi:hypothetical protein
MLNTEILAGMHCWGRKKKRSAARLGADLVRRHAASFVVVPIQRSRRGDCAMKVYRYLLGLGLAFASIPNGASFTDVESLTDARSLSGGS